MKSLKVRRRKTAVSLTLFPTPFYKVDTRSLREARAHPYDSRAVRLFYFWLIQNWKNLEQGWPVARFKLARDLNVHRCVIDDWCEALRLGHYTTLSYNRVRPIDVIALRDPYPQDEEWLRKSKVILSTVDYDPWRDRRWDKRFSNQWFPYNIDEYVDKYYLVFRDEHRIWFKVPRMLSSGRCFKPVTDKRTGNGHPISEAYKDSKDRIIFYDCFGKRKAPPIERRREVYNLCQGKAGIRKSSRKKETTLFKDWATCAPVRKARKKIQFKSRSKRGRVVKNKVG